MEAGSFDGARHVRPVRQRVRAGHGATGRALHRYTYTYMYIYIHGEREDRREEQRERRTEGQRRPAFPSTGERRPAITSTSGARHREPSEAALPE